MSGRTRNHPCHCSSGAKYKRCCLEKDEAKKREAINIELSDILKDASVKECLYLDKTGCSERIIKAHSIQNNRVLDRLSENGEVLMARHAATSEEFRIVMKPIGRKAATTFTGFCSYHDNIVFKPIEESDYVPGDARQETLFAFRALAKEWHAKLRARNAYSAHADHPILALGLEGTELALKDIERHVETFRQILLEGHLELLETVHISFEQEYGLAVSSGVSFPYDFEGGRLDHLHLDLKEPSRFLFLTVFPQSGKTHVLLSYLAEHREFYSFIKSQLFDVSPDQQKIRLNNLIMMNCENLVLAPSHWNKFSSDQQRFFLDMFNANLSAVEKPETLGTDFGFSLFN